ncbi:hypothetical protein BDB00DRAFT_306604 [Zychaea mexicana]|uniref:uncharacterized protein n=1 Tax=Zychaea mexicana TaxID=64656 RepID=UPI0022FE297F|nr:uncharacterized protein BDB00DRAFT_306604 [Zychaea mexicana]KAI9494505.1 hypothetical protein BDB00DRAFT_306604 [Zychaea mexicana]
MFMNYINIQPENEEVRNALHDLQQNCFVGICDPAEIFKRQKVRLQHVDVLRKFYYSNAALNEHRHREIATSRFYTQLATKERQYIRSITSKKLGIPFRNLRPVMCVGLAGTGVGSHQRGRPRRGGRKMRNEHRVCCPVVLQDEYRTSQTCLFCFCPLVMATATKATKNGKIKTVKVLGALQCVNPDCPAVRVGYTTFSHDSLSSTAMIIAAVTQLFSPTKSPLPPFDPTSPTQASFTFSPAFLHHPSYHL